MKLQEYYENVRQHAKTMKQYAFNGLFCLYDGDELLGRPPCFVGILLAPEVRASCDHPLLGFSADQIADEGILVAEDASPNAFGVFLCDIQFVHDWQAMDMCSTSVIITDQDRAQMIERLDAVANVRNLKVVVD